jgi:hypothetical protein
MRRREQNSTDHPIMFFMADSADHLTGKTGLTPIVTLSKNGGSFGAAVGTVAEVGNGWYKLAGNATDRNTLGTLVLHAESAGADTFDMDIEILASDPPTVEEIDGQLTDEHGPGDWGAGVGLMLKEYTLTQDDNPVAGVGCYCTSDEEGLIRISPVRFTNSLGIVVFQLDVPIGTHVWVWHIGATVGDEEIV